MKKIVAVIAIAGLALVVSGSAQAGLLQGTYAPPGNMHHHVEDGAAPGVWEYDCIDVWGVTRCVFMTQDGSGIIGYSGQTEVLPTSVHQSGNANNDGWQSSWWNTRDGQTMGNNNPDLDFLVYDLGATYSLENAYLWQGTQDDHSDVGIRDFSLEVSTDSDPRTATWSVAAAGLTLAKHPNPGGDVSAQVFAMNADARLVRINVASSWHPNGWVGLLEAGFSEPAPPVAEPAGLGLVGLALLAVRKRRA